MVKLVNQELDSTNGVLKDKLDAIDAELNDVKLRLSRLYGILETERKLNLNDLAPRIKNLGTRQEQLLKAKVQTEADMVLQGVQHVDTEAVKSYAQNLHNWLGETDLTTSKNLLRSFVKRIVINGDKAKVRYHLPMPPDGKKTQSVGVVPIETSSGPFGTVPELLFENKRLIPSIQQLLTSHI